MSPVNRCCSYRRSPRLLFAAAFVFLMCAGLACSSLVYAQDAPQTKGPEILGASSAPAEIDVIPLPAIVQTREGSLAITQSFSVALTGSPDAVLRRAAQRFLRNLSRQTGMPLARTLADHAPATLAVVASQAMKPVQEMGADESYTLDIGTSGAKLTAATDLGVLHGFETFLQLVNAGPDGLSVPVIHIDDKPRFAWRGLMIDVSRHFIPLEVLRRNLDGMAAVKMNVLHLHLSDDQGFRAESKRFPLLHEMGSDGLFYTQAEMRELIAYASDRGIRIVPEFDMPGHATSWLVGYPKLASGPGPFQIERRWGVFDPALDPTREDTYKFVDRLVGEMAALFPDAYFHIGGDEVNGKQWDANREIQKFMKTRGLKNDRDLQQYFTARVQSIVAKHHKVMLGWDEVLTPGIPKEIVIQSWRGQKSLAEAASLGYRGLLSSGYYLDGMAHASQYYSVDPLVGKDGSNVAALSPDAEKLILGGEACMWAEFVTEENIDSRIWPRTAAIAERLWSPAQVQDADAMYRRLDTISWRLDLLGLTHRSGYHAMLGRILESKVDDRAAFDTLLDVVEPAGIGSREQAANRAGGMQTSQTPLNRLVDAIPPESEASRRFTQAVNKLAASNFTDPQTLAFVRSELTSWRDNDARLEPGLQQSYLLHELIPVSQTLAALGAAGLQSLDSIAKGEPTTLEWQQQQLVLMQQAEKPISDLMVVIAPAVTKLVEASGKVSPQK